MRALLIGILWASACWITEARDDLLSSPLWIWGWILVPLAAAAMGRLDDTPLPVIAAGVTFPMAVAFVVHGDPPQDPGPASWPIGVLLTLALAGICLAAARAGRATRPIAADAAAASGPAPGETATPTADTGAVGVADATTTDVADTTVTGVIDEAVPDAPADDTPERSSDSVGEVVSRRPAAPGSCA